MKTIKQLRIIEKDVLTDMKERRLADRSDKRVLRIIANLKRKAKH